MQVSLNDVEKPEIERIEEIKELVEVLEKANEELNIEDRDQVREIRQMSKDIIDLFSDIETSYKLLQDRLFNIDRRK